MTDKAADSSNRVARVAALVPIAAQRSHPLPQEVADMIWSRQLLPVITRADEVKSAFGTSAPIRGAGDMAMTYAVCPANTGPTFHSHRRTYETFTVMQGRVEFSTMPKADDAPTMVILERFDTISVAPLVYRAFRAV